MLPTRAARPPATEDAVLEEAVRRLIDAIQPERIYLFGSRARGDATEDSDYDLLAHVSGDGSARREQERAVGEALRGIGAPVHVVVQSSTAFERTLPVVASLSATVAREGRLLYGEPPPKREWDPVDVDEEKAYLTRDWMARAARDLETAERAAQDPPILDTIVYHCQQAFETVLKGFLTWNDRPFRKTHKLPELVEWCADLDADFAQLLESSAIVSPYAYQFRYPFPNEHGVVVFRDPTDEQAEGALRFAREAFNFVLARLPERARP